jgi:hypothetical protein
MEITMRRRSIASVFVCSMVAFGCGPAPADAPKAQVSGSGDSTTVTMPTGLSITVPKDWKPQPASGMRQAQWTLAKAEGDPEDASLVVYHFGGQGGSVDANVERWYGQFERPDGKSVKDSAKVEKKDVSGLKLTIVDVSGTYVAPPMPGQGEKSNKPGQRMLAAVVEGEGGPWYLKLLGPEKSVLKHEKEFQAALGTLALKK